MNSLGPSLRHRIVAISRPGWARTILARRLLAAALAVLGVALFLRGDPNSERSVVVVAGHDLAPGRVLGTDDVHAVDHESGSLPEGALHNPSDVIGRTLVGATRRGETITDVRVVGPRLAAAATGSGDARIVPVRLADVGVAELLREGDRVDVVTTVDGADDHAVPDATMLASDAAVVLVSGADGGKAMKDRVVMLALPAREAAAVAAASLTRALTVVFH